MERRAEGARDLGRRHHGGHRKSVSDSLGHGHDVGRDAVRLEVPKVFAGPAEARLHLVGHAHAAVAPDQLVHPFQIALRELDDPSDALRERESYRRVCY